MGVREEAQPSGSQGKVGDRLRREAEGGHQEEDVGVQRGLRQSQETPLGRVMEWNVWRWAEDFCSQEDTIRYQRLLSFGRKRLTLARFLRQLEIHLS